MSSIGSRRSYRAEVSQFCALASFRNPECSTYLGVSPYKIDIDKFLARQFLTLPKIHWYWYQVKHEAFQTVIYEREDRLTYMPSRRLKIRTEWLPGSFEGIWNPMVWGSVDTEGAAMCKEAFGESCPMVDKVESHESLSSIRTRNSFAYLRVSLRRTIKVAKTSAS